MSAAEEALRRLTATVPDFPQPGVLFRDLTPVLADAEGLRAVAEGLVEGAEPFDAIAGIEARGFVLAAAAAVLAGTGVVLVRKAGKLPRPRFRESYQLEYGTAELELSGTELPPGSRVLLVDDVLATGGTLRAATDLLARSEYLVVGAAVAVELPALGGRSRLGELAVRALIEFD